MGMTTSVCVLWGCLILLNFSSGYDYDSEATKALQDGVAEPRNRHRLQLLFPLLLRISSRLATLVPTAIMGLIGIIIFVVFSKKALIVSLIALFLTLSGKYGSKHEDVYIHKVESYPDYNDEEHIHYHHHGPPKYKIYYPGGDKKWKVHLKREIPSLPLTPNFIPLHDNIDTVNRIKHFSDFHTRMKDYQGFRLNIEEEKNLVHSEAEEWNTPKRQVNWGYD